MVSIVVVSLGAVCGFTRRGDVSKAVAHKMQ